MVHWRMPQRTVSRFRLLGSLLASQGIPQEEAWGEFFFHHYRWNKEAVGDWRIFNDVDDWFFGNTKKSIYLKFPIMLIDAY